MTITEALAEIKTIGKRLETKKQFVLQNLGRDSRLLDPLEGGSVQFIKRERQAIADLEKRIVTIRTAIQKSNFETSATVGEMTYTVSEWLTFRREVAANRQMFLNAINGAVRGVREKVQREGGRVNVAGVSATAIVEGNKAPLEVIIYVNERELLEEQEGLEKTLGELDGKLSLLNATTTIDV